MRLGIKTKQVLSVTSIVSIVVIVLSLVHVSTIARFSLEESHSRGQLLAKTIFQQAQRVVIGKDDPYKALQADPGLRSILESSIAYSKDVTDAAIVDAQGSAVAHSDPSLENKPIAARPGLEPLFDQSRLALLWSIFRDEGRTLDISQPLQLGERRFGSIRIGISTLLVREGVRQAVGGALATALIGLVVATAIAMLLAQLILRPIHVIRGGLTKLGKGEFVTLDLPPGDEFGDLGQSFDVMSAQLSAERSQLAGQKAKLESVVEHLEDAVAIFNPDLELLFVNPAMRETLVASHNPPLPVDLMVGEKVSALLGPDHAYRKVLEQTIAGHRSVGPISAVIGRDDSGHSAERLIMTHLIPDRDQRIVGIMLVARNLEYLGHVQSTINYSRKLAALGRLSAGVAHEVKNPLNAMMIHLELLRGKLGIQASGGQRGFGVAPATLDLPAATRHVNVIAEEIRRLDQVVQGFLKFTRPEDLKLQPVDVAALIKELTTVVGPEAQKSGVALRTTGLDIVPEVNGDPAMLHQAFLNLALNACQAMPQGGTLTIACRPRGDRVELRFEDTGVGIEPTHLEKIFDLYFTTKEHGSGIGLSMVYRIIQLHDGAIEVASTPGHGTMFTVLLPRA